MIMTLCDVVNTVCIDFVNEEYTEHGCVQAFRLMNVHCACGFMLLELWTYFLNVAWSWSLAFKIKNMHHTVVHCGVALLKQWIYHADCLFGKLTSSDTDWLYLRLVQSTHANWEDLLTLATPIHVYCILLWIHFWPFHTLQARKVIHFVIFSCM